ncbi:MAG: hypothetical protein ACYDBJ_05415 [Aggregatilineales bacterium]
MLTDAPVNDVIAAETYPATIKMIHTALAVSPTLDVGHHNVSDLLESLSPEQRTHYGHKYDQRAPEQVATREGLIMTWDRPAAATFRHMRYRAELARQHIHVVSPTGAFDLDGQPIDLRALIGGRPLRVVPYFPSRSIEGLVQRSLPGIATEQRSHFGLPTEVAELVKDKAQFHYFMQDHFPTLIPRFDVLSGTDLIGIDNGESPIEIVMLQTAELIRAARENGLHMDGYRNGVVLRKILSDGGFGTLIVRQRLHDEGYEVIGDRHLQDVNLHHLMRRILDLEPLYLMTRLLELDASPGISCLVENGELHPLPLNGQIQDESGAAVGTRTLGLSESDKRDILFREEHEDIIQALAHQIFDKVLALCPDRSGVNALINLDFMVTTEREQKLYTLVENTPGLRAHFWHLMSSRYQVAETNPRMTNLTSAANGVLTILGTSHTIENYRRLLAVTGDLGLANYDSRYLNLPAGMALDDVYAHFLDRHHAIRAHGYDEAGVILRMMPPLVDGRPDWSKGAGITLYGPKRAFAEIERLALG